MLSEPAITVQDHLVIPGEESLAVEGTRLLDSTPLPFDCAQGRQLCSPSTLFGAGCSE
jgi:hypothetical protein